jgi:MFS family permease
MKLNRIIKYLILADLSFWSGWGLVNPIFAIYLSDGIVDGSAIVAGTAFGIYWTTKSLLQYPIGLFLDRTKGDKDDYFFLVLGFLIASSVPIGYAFSDYSWQIYILQFVYGIAMAMSIAGWRALFTRSIDRGQESSQWCLDEALLGLGQGIFGVMSGICVAYMGYDSTFLIASCLGVMGVVLLIQLRNDIRGVFDDRLIDNFRRIFMDK